MKKLQIGFLPSKMRKLFGLVFLICTVILVTTVCFFQFNKQSEMTYYYYAPEQVIDHYEFMGDKGAVAIRWKDKNPKEAKELREQIQAEIDSGARSEPYDAIIGGGFDGSTAQYVIKDSYKLKSNPLRLIEQDDQKGMDQKGDYWYVDFYKVNDNSIDTTPRRIDLLKAVYDYNQEYFPIEVSDLVNKKYLYIVVGKKKTSSRPQTKGVYLNIQTGKIVGMQEAIQDISVNRFWDIDLPLSLTIEHEDRGFDYWRHQLTYSDNEKAKEWKVAQNYPKVHQILLEGGGLFVLSDMWQDRQIADILQEFEVPGVDVFKDSRVYKSESKDGQEHVVNSFDEYLKWYGGKSPWVKDE